VRKGFYFQRTAFSRLLNSTPLLWPASCSKSRQLASRERFQPAKRALNHAPVSADNMKNGHDLDYFRTGRKFS
jgi:hypothetical protein